jgi:hypothetical protein
MIRKLSEWTVDYGDGPIPVQVPHSWRQEVPVEWEGPAVYRTAIDLQPWAQPVLRFWGVSYACEVWVDGALALRHAGIWDSFDVALPAGRESVAVEVRVTKNGGASDPVAEVLSGFLPFVFQTFGGIFREVWVGEGFEPLERPVPASRAAVRGRQVFFDGQPVFLRGLLHWGWYPELGHPNPSAEGIAAEIRQAQELGFKLVKFCLWLPPHRYLEQLAEAGLMAWIELPLWDPAPSKLAEMTAEVERIVRQYAHHANVVAWTAGCELGHRVSHSVRRELFEMVAARTGCPLVKDNSGGSEMYGADLREYGTFEDFHPYCDLPFYPDVLDSLTSDPATGRPIVLGEFNDIDVHRDLPAIRGEYWASSDADLNAQGVRWQFDLPSVLDSFSWSTERHARLMASSREKALFIRKTVHESVRARAAISGYVVTGWRDTPISSAGFFDDFGQARFSAEECAAWNGPDCLFLIPARRPPWVHGGNRAGWRDPVNHFAGPIQFRVGLASEAGYEGEVRWTFGEATGTWAVSVPALASVRVGTIDLDDVPPGEYVLTVESNRTRNSWSIWVVENGSTDMGSVVLVGDERSEPMPFWREAAYEFVGLEDFAEQWARWQPISGDRAIPLDRLPEGAEVLMRRIDTRTYRESAVIARCGEKIWTTTRPFGGLGNQPTGLEVNPAGVALLRALNSI